MALGIFLLRVLLVFVVLNLNIENNVLRECVFYLKIDLESLVKFSRFLNDLN